MAKQIHYKPYERSQLSSLAQALGHGLDPNMGLQLFQGVQSGALARMQAMQAARQQALATISQSLAGLAQSNPDPAAGTALEQTLASATPGMQGPKIQGKLSDMLSQIYPTTGQPSPLYQAPAGATAPGGVPPDVLALADATMKTALGGTDASGSAPAIPGSAAPDALHNARMAVMTRARAMGLDSQQLQALYTYMGNAWEQTGGHPLGYSAPPTPGGTPSASNPGGFPANSAYSPRQPGVGLMAFLQHLHQQLNP